MPAATVDVNSNSSSTVIPSLVLKLTRGFWTKLGQLTAANTGVAFSISEPTYNSQGVMAIQVNGTAGTTATLECSIDGGNNWFIVPALSGAAAYSVTGQLTGDSAAAAAFAYTISGLGGALFKFGYAGAGVPTATVFALIG